MEVIVRLHRRKDALSRRMSSVSFSGRGGRGVVHVGVVDGQDLPGVRICYESQAQLEFCSLDRQTHL
jgi:hypothetical protein